MSAAQTRGVFVRDQVASPLRVKRLDAIPVALPLKKPMLMAGSRIEHASNMLVRIEADNGLVGWGEAASAPTMTGDTTASMAAIIRDHLAPLVVGGDALARGALAQRIGHAVHHNPGAKAAVEVALNDLVGKHLGVSIADMFGGVRRTSIVPMYLLGNSSVDDDIAEARAQFDEGFRFFKLKCGVKSVQADIEALAAVRHAVGPDVRLCADANTGMRLDAARRFVARAAEFDLEFLEQPLGVDNMQGMAELARMSSIAMCADESIGSLSDVFGHHRAGAIRGVNLKVIKCGGIAATVQAATVADALGLSIKLACKVAESSIGAATLTHVAYVVGNVDWGVSLSNVYLADDLVRSPVLPIDGQVARPTGPGLGIDVNERAVERYRST
jgi:muconate cycloisomerase